MSLAVRTCAAVSLALAALASTPAAAGPLVGHCGRPAELDAPRQDTLLRFSAIIRSTLEDSGARLAIVARSGLDLGRFGLRYSHAGLSLRASPNTPWSVRQLYYDCDEGRSRIFDEGLAGFVTGTGDPSAGYVVAILVPGAEAALERTARDDRLALRLVGGRYSANAFAFGLDHQNCNQWLAELMGVAWGDLMESADPRADAQRWLMAEGYEPTRIDVGNPLLVLAAAVLPWTHLAGHPAADLEAGRFRVSMPQSIEGFARTRVPGARRIEFCHANGRVVVREGWEPIAPGCEPGGGDRVIELDRGRLTPSFPPSRTSPPRPTS